MLDVVEQAVEAHLLEAERDGTRVRFVHALTREALYEGILPPRRRALASAVAEALLASASPDPDAVAYHLQQAGDPRAWDWLVKAGDRAQRAYAWVTAAERLQAAAALLERVEGEGATRCRLLAASAISSGSRPTRRHCCHRGRRADCARIGDAAIAAELPAIARGSALLRWISSEPDARKSRGGRGAGGNSVRGCADACRGPGVVRHLSSQRRPRSTRSRTNAR